MCKIGIRISNIGVGGVTGKQKKEKGDMLAEKGKGFGVVAMWMIAGFLNNYIRVS